MKTPSTVFKVVDVLYATFVVMEERGGFVSTKQAESKNELPTTHYVLELLKSKTSAVQHWPPETVAKINSIVHHFRSLNSDTDDFLQKVQQILSVGVVTNRMIGYIVALPSLFERKTERASKLVKFAEKYAASKYIGKLSIRDEFFVKVLDIVDFLKKDETTGENIPLHMFRVADEHGNLGLFFTKEKPPIEVYDCFTMRGTPKKHSVNKDNGVRETQFSRVRVTEVVGKGSEE